MDVEFDPERCAELHNRLLSRTYEAVPGSKEHFERNMISRVQEDMPDAATWLLAVDEEQSGQFTVEDLPFHRFFSRINLYSPPGWTQTFVPLSGEFKQPEPAYFYHPHLEDDERHIILLYQDNVLHESIDGGLFLDLDTWMVTWARLEGSQIPTDLEAWVPLELALRKGLEMWDRQKYYWDGDPTDRNSAIRLRSWTARDLDEALQAWDMLLDAIQSRLPPGSVRQAESVWGKPLPPELVDEFKLSPFAMAFLKAAKRPPFTYVAPGMTTFNQETFSMLMRAELPDAPRQREIARIGLEPDEWPSLVLPAASTVQLIPQNPSPPGDVFFDKPWGCGRFVIARKAGLYTNLLREDGDSTFFITAEGRVNPINYRYQRPWGHPRHLTFAEMFELWTYYIQEGLWEVGHDGVSTPHSWFTDSGSAEARAVYWGAHSR